MVVSGDEDWKEWHTKMEERLDDFDGTEDGAGAQPFEPPKGGFGAFQGNFVVDITDEEKKAATLRGWATELNTQKRFTYVQRRGALLAPQRYDFCERRVLRVPRAMRALVRACRGDGS